MMFGKVEVTAAPLGKNEPCRGGNHTDRAAIAYFKGSPVCAECLGAEFLHGDDARELVGHLVAELLPKGEASLTSSNEGFQRTVSN